jgi:hypothetical protein
MKKPPSVLHNPYSAPVWETTNRLPNIKLLVPAFFGDQFIIKAGGLRTHITSAKEVRGLELFLYESDKNFEHFENR